MCYDSRILYIASSTFVSSLSPLPSLPQASRVLPLLSHVDYLKPNRAELAAIAHALRARDTPTSHPSSPPSASTASNREVFLSPPSWPLPWPEDLRTAVTESLADLAILLHEGCRGIFLSLGPQGALLARRARANPLTRAGAGGAAAAEYGLERSVHLSIVHVPALPARVASLVGAGDCFVAGAVAALARGERWKAG